jgi:NlpC/P60 family putative phage cell wall peptidase
MTERVEIADEVRKWVRTPYHHQARVLGVGVDCVQLIVGTGEPIGILELDEYFRRNKEWHNYSRTPNPRALIAFCDRYLHRIPKESYKLGDILVFAWRAHMPQHFGIVSSWEPKRMVHAHSEVKWCAEHSLDKEWLDRHVASYTWKPFAGEYA